MTPQNRNRIQWLLAALVSVHIVVVTAVFLGTGTFPNGLLVLTLVLYAGIGALSLAFLALGGGRRPRTLTLVPRASEEPERIVIDDAASPPAREEARTKDVT